MAQISASSDLGTRAKNQHGQCVQTEYKAHGAWANLIARKLRAAELSHHLIAHMGRQNAVVVPQRVLAKVMERSLDTVQRAVRDLFAVRWIQIVRISSGKEAAYVANDREAWRQAHGQLRLSVFSATVITDTEDQNTASLDHVDLRRIPTSFPCERQLPIGDGEPPPLLPSLDGLEPDLPTRSGLLEH